MPGPTASVFGRTGEAQRTTGDRSGCTVPGVNKSTEVPQFQPFAAATRPGVRAPQHSRGTNVLAPIENIPRAVAQAGPGQNQTTKPTSTAVRATPTGAAAPGTGVAIKQEVTDDAQALVPTGTTHRQENAPPPYQEARANQDARNRHMPGPLDDLKDCLQRAVAAATAAEVKVASLERDVVAHEHEMERVGACVQNRERLMWARENRLKAQLKAKVEAVKIAEGRLAAAQGQLEVERGLLEVERARHAEQNAMLEQQLGDTVGRRDHAERSAQGPRAKLEAVGFYVGAGQAF
ncbi:hypothetical protein EVJ58_g1103 [Rhodofomes roseus]|uniref:Uncharacterized protein n=1 Tax=Rhodofomes roseus TaxID=34475 RepID=A0A4Y9Z4J5_9APHY|nr:hypothetical protein EVJ58_g1103 [Rhodofomes roseus]